MNKVKNKEIHLVFLIQFYNLNKIFFIIEPVPESTALS